MTVLLLPFQFRFLLFLFFPLVAVIGTSKIILNESGESGHFVLFLILGKMLSVFTVKYDVNCGFVSSSVQSLGRVQRFATP